jgi:hypothetical protein
MSYRNYNAGELKQVNPEARQDRPPNFRDNGKLFLIRCFVCGDEYGRENHAMYVARGECAWCGWKG